MTPISSLRVHMTPINSNILTTTKINNTRATPRPNSLGQTLAIINSNIRATMLASSSHGTKPAIKKRNLLLSPSKLTHCKENLTLL